MTAKTLSQLDAISNVTIDDIFHGVNDPAGANNDFKIAASDLRTFMSPYTNVKDFGAKGDGVADDSLAIQAAISATPRGTVYFPSGIYKCTNLLTTDSTKLLGCGWEFNGGTTLQNINLTTPILTIVRASMAGCQISNILFNDQQIGSTADCIVFHSEGNSTFERVYIHGAGGYGLRIVGNTSVLTLRNCFIQHCALDGIYGRAEASAQINAINILDCEIAQNTGHGINLWARNQLNIRGCTIQGNQRAGIYINADDMTTVNSSANTYNITENYFELNKGGNIVALTAFDDASSTVHFALDFTIADNFMTLSIAQANVGVTSHISLTGYIGSYKGMVIGRNHFAGDLAYIDFGSAHDYRTILIDSRSDAQAFSSVYLGTSVANITIISTVQQRRIAVAYSASMTPDISTGNEFVITATNGVGFTINAPVNPMTRQRLTIRIRNTSGGSLGTATWGSVYKMASWTQPASGYSRAIDFQYDGTNWVEASRTPSDVPN